MSDLVKKGQFKLKQMAPYYPERLLPEELQLFSKLAIPVGNWP
jgi:hypothetical protein